MWNSIKENNLPVCNMEIDKHINLYRSMTCVVLINERTPEIAYYETVQFPGEDASYTWYSLNTGDIIENVTHWMYIPSLQ